MRRGAAMLCFLATGSMAPTAAAQAPKEAVRGRLFSVDGRHELKPIIGVAVTDAYRRDWLFGAAYAAHLSDEWGLSVRAMYAAGTDTALTEAIRAVDPGLAGTLTVRPLQLLVTAEGQWIPFYGKLVMFGKALLHYDTAVVLGVGVSRFDTVGFDFAWSFGLQARLFFTRRIGLDIGVRDFVLRKVDPVTGGKPPFHKLVFSIGPTFLL